MGTIAHAYGSGEQASNEGIFSNLVVLARVDGKVDAEEMVLLERVARRLSLTPEQVKEIVKHPEEYPMIPPAGKEERFERLIQFIEMTAADGTIVDSEMRMVVRYSIALGFDEEHAPEITEKIIRQISAGQDRDTILKSLM